MNAVIMFKEMHSRGIINEKEFIDELRCRNGNLTILLTAIDDKTSFKG